MLFRGISGREQTVGIFLIGAGCCAALQWILQAAKRSLDSLAPFNCHDAAAAAAADAKADANANAFPWTMSSMDAIFVPSPPRALMDDQGQQLPLLYNHRFLASPTTLLLAKYPS